MDAYATFNQVLVHLFQEILDLEAKAIITDEFRDITNNDMHIIEAVGLGSGSNMSTIAKRLRITVGSLTTSMNQLVKKMYVFRERSEEDRRIVNISLTEKGVRAYEHHRDFHEQMTRAAMKELTEEETGVLMRCLNSLSDFFHSYADKENESRKPS